MQGFGMTVVDGRRARGARSRHAVLDIAVNVASVSGLDGLSIGGLAQDASISKSGVVALFGTKESLQLATIAAAREVFIAEVVTPTLAVTGGFDRLAALVANWLDYSENRIFAGGCFFAAAIIEVGSKPGPVRDAVGVAVDEWYDLVGRTIVRARDRGELVADVDVDALAFAITAYLDAANARSLIGDGPQPYVVARRAAATLLAANRSGT